MESMDRFCSSCGSGIYKNDRFCRKCGSDLGQGQPIEQGHETQPEDSTLPKIDIAKAKPTPESPALEAYMERLDKNPTRQESAPKAKGWKIEGKKQTKQESAALDAVTTRLKKEPKTQPEDSMDYIKHIWNGNGSLPFTYWVIWVIGNLILTVLDMALDYWGVYDSIWAVALLVFVVFTLGYFIYAAVSVWRSANKFEGAKVWAVLAQLSVILGILRTIGEVAALF